LTKSGKTIRNIVPLYGIMNAGPRMALLSRKDLLAIAAVIDVALRGRGRPVSAKALAARHALPARHLEPVLQALVRVGILKGIRGPRGGYELARERRRITADDILRAAGTMEDASDPAAAAGSALLNDVVIPAVGQAERAFSVALSRINLDDLVRRAEPLRDATT
jgi:Rrf2 family transcriptional regulator, iron-sulfur cluster assembly transcription factor